MVNSSAQSVFVSGVRFVDFLKNYLSSVLLAYLALYFYTKISVFHFVLYSGKWAVQWFEWSPCLVLTTPKILLFVFGFYSAFMFFRCLSDESFSKSRLVFLSVASFLSGKSLGYCEKQACLQTLVKFLFLPFVINIVISDFSFLNFKFMDAVTYYGLSQAQRDFMYPDVLAILLKVVLMIVYCFDVVPFVVGYLTDSTALGNKVKSVDSTLLGWGCCFACYAPFNTAVSSFFPSVVPESVLPFEGVPYLHYGVTLLSVVLLGLYASASVSLGWKASNLTSRGVVDTGLYAYVRHPAYVCKNAAWWVLSLAWAVHQYLSGGVFWYALFSLAVWTYIYYLRAVTEERHLLASDPDYLKYSQRVRYRFIPNFI